MRLPCTYSRKTEAKHNVAEGVAILIAIIPAKIGIVIVINIYAYSIPLLCAKEHHFFFLPIALSKAWRDLLTLSLSILLVPVWVSLTELFIDN